MAFCRFCGKELGEDGKCTCAEFQDNEKLEEIVTPASEKKDKPIKRGGALKCVIAFLILILVGALAVFIMISINSYKKPIKTLAKGITKADTELIIESMYTQTTEAAVRLKAQENGLAWGDYLKQNDKAIESSMKGLGIKRVKAKVLAKEKISGSNLDQIKEYYTRYYGVDVKKAYRIEVDFTLKINGEKISKNGWLTVVKLKGEGWKYCSTYSTSSFDFIDQAIMLE